MKSNKTFMILSALGILFVVDAHSLSSLMLMTVYFDYNSFFMPMFMFISGYFFSKKYIDNITGTIARKAKRMLIPYFIWGCVYCIFEYIMQQRGWITYDLDFNLKDLIIKPFTVGYVCELTQPTWFIMALFMTQVVYILARKILRPVWNDIAAMIILIIMGAASVYASRAGYNTGILLPVMKVGFFLQFYHLGVFYRKYIEKYFRRCNKAVIMSAAIVINTVLIYIYNNQLMFLDLAKMSGFTTSNVFLPLISSITGISFWLCVAMILEEPLGKSRLVNFISDHTFEIMTHHYFFFYIYNTILYLISMYVIELQYFDAFAFNANSFYRYQPIFQFRVFYLLIGMAGPLLAVWIKDRFKMKVVSMREKRR